MTEKIGLISSRLPSCLVGSFIHSFIHSYLITPMLDSCEGAVVDLPQVFVIAHWAPRTTTEDVVHGLTLLASQHI